jgi:hypothetical protein
VRVVLATAVAAGVFLAPPGFTGAAGAASPCATDLKIEPPSGTIWRLQTEATFIVRLTLAGGSGHYYWQEYNEAPPGFTVSFYPRQNGSPEQSLTGEPTKLGTFQYYLNLYDYPNYAPQEPNGLYPPGHGMYCGAGAKATYTFIVVSGPALYGATVGLHKSDNLLRQARDSPGDPQLAFHDLLQAQDGLSGLYHWLGQLHFDDPENTLIQDAINDVDQALVDIKLLIKLADNPADDPVWMNGAVDSIISAYLHVDTYSQSVIER